jgi:predicted transcriptional regulator
MTKEIHIGIGDPVASAKAFIDAWKQVERGEDVAPKQSLHFEDLETLLRTLTRARWVLLKRLRKKGPMSVRALSKLLARDYKNVHTDVQRLERVGLVGRTHNDNVEVPWDIVEARLSLAA